jgi:transmembrane sensor
VTRENEELMSISEQAAYWSVVFRDGDATPAEMREFVAWVRQSPQHVEEVVHIARARAAVLRSGVQWPATSVEDLVRDACAASGENVVALRSKAVPRREPTRRRALPVAVGLAASLILAACLTWFSLSRPEQFQTKVGEQRLLLLGDGSRVTLNTASVIEVRMRRDRRIVDLLKGEALFEVAHDAARPFDVRVGDTTARAVGTRFDIARRTTHTAITVVEGHVAVELGGVTRMEPIQLFEADRFILEATGSSRVERGVDLNEAIAWTQRLLVFNRRPLGEIADEFNRYSVAQIEIRSPVLRARQMTGTFPSDDLGSFVSLLAGIPGAHVAGSPATGYIVTFDEAAEKGR